mmetsp:Transcript_100938/g.200523  ORF Transcript_100938/g.200523 Transcript_100938/m.200523 type:complete len:106 (+) Transcript_100938:676-993(+)
MSCPARVPKQGLAVLFIRRVVPALWPKGILAAVTSRMAMARQRLIAGHAAQCIQFAAQAMRQRGTHVHVTSGSGASLRSLFEQRRKRLDVSVLYIQLVFVALDLG